MYYKLSILLLLSWLLSGCSAKTIHNADAAEKEARYIVDNLDKPAIIQYFHEQYFNPDRVNDLIKRMQDCHWHEKECRRTSTEVNYSSGKNTAGFGFECKSSCGEISLTLFFNIDNDKPELSNIIIEESLGKGKRKKNSQW